MSEQSPPTDEEVTRYATDTDSGLVGEIEGAQALRERAVRDIMDDTGLVFPWHLRTESPEAMDEVYRECFRWLVDTRALLYRSMNVAETLAEKNDELMAEIEGEADRLEQEIRDQLNDPDGRE